MNKHLLKQCGIAIGLYILFISSIWGYIFTPTQQLQASWEQELDRYLESSRQLTSLVDDFGYGGFLDNFQEFLKTRDIGQLEQAIDYLEIILLRLHTLKQLNNDNQTALELIDSINSAVLNYESIAKTLKQNISFSAFMSYSIVKRKITVQDPDILYALDNLIDVNGQTLHQVKTKTADLKKAHDNALLYWSIGATIFYLIAAVVSILLYQSFRNTYTQLEWLNNHSPMATLLFNKKGSVLQINHAFKQVFGISDAENLKDIELEYILPTVFEQSEVLFLEEQPNEEAGKVMRFIIDANRIDNALKQVPVEVRVSLIEMEGSQVAFCVINDKSKEERLQRKARTDSLTKVFNRGYAEELIDIELTRIQRNNKTFCVLMVDIDYFKKVNDTLGHNAGDNLLKSLVSLFKKSLRKSDIMARWGGDEFLIILPDTSYEYAEIVSAKLVNLAHYAFKDGAVETSVSIGSAMAEKEDTITTLVNKADEALYETKLRGRNGYTMYNHISPDS